MSDTRKVALAAVSAVVLFGTAYSVVYDTYLDTSNPLLTHLPHPLSKTHYWARKSNVLNTYFIKAAWGWTSAAFLLLWVTSPASVRTPSRLGKWALETLSWMIFTSWFFGPALLERVIVASGGECVMSSPTGDQLSLPNEYCYSKQHVSPESHPELFTTSFSVPDEWSTLPRLRRGHDVSGHIFLLTMSVLFLADQLRPSLRVQQWSLYHKLAVAANVSLIGIWLFASYTTSAYFHTPGEKITGFCESDLFVQGPLIYAS